MHRAGSGKDCPGRRVFLVSVLQAEIAFDGQVNAPERVPDRLNVFRPFRDSGAESGDQQLKIKSADKTEIRMPDTVVIMVSCHEKISVF